MSGYSKLFASIVHSTIWRAPDHVRLVWITMLAMSDRDGLVEASVPGLADAARVSLDHCLAALEALSSPDEWSRTKTDDGRRIRAVEGGWIVINYTKHRDSMSKAVQRQQVAERVARYRDRKRGNADVTPVTVGNGPATLGTHTDPAPDPDTTTKTRAAAARPRVSGVLPLPGVEQANDVQPGQPSFAEEVHAYWQRTMRFPDRKLTPDRRRHLEARRREGLTVAKAKRAIDGCRASAWHMGDNDRGRPYNEISSIFCSATRVDEMCARAPGAPAAIPGAPAGPACPLCQKPIGDGQPTLSTGRGMAHARCADQARGAAPPARMPVPVKQEPQGAPSAPAAGLVAGAAVAAAGGLVASPGEAEDDIPF